MAFVCDMGYRNGNSVHLWRKVMFPSQQSDMQISQRQTVQETNCWRPLQRCRETSSQPDIGIRLWTRSKADKGNTISGWIHLTKERECLWLVTRTTTPPEVEEADICSTQLSRTLLPRNVKATYGKKTPHCHPTEINKVHRKQDRGIYKGEKITKYQNRHKRHQMTPLSGYWDGQVIKSCVLVCFSAAATSSINKEHLKRREVHLADTSRSQCVSEESWDRNLKQKSWRNTAV